MSIILFSMQSSRPLGERIAAGLKLKLAEHEERDFADGEHKSRPLQNVRGADVYVVHSLFANTSESVNDKLMRLLFFIGALKDASAARVTAVIPYLCYARKDRKTKPRDPVTTRYLASMFEAVRTDRIVTLDVHNLAAYQNSFRITADHLEAKNLFVDHLQGIEGEVVVVSPDVGGVKRAEAFRLSLQERRGLPVSSAFMEKHRSAGVVTGDTLVGDVSDRTVIIVDDLIASGGTLRRAAQACHLNNARKVIGVATHGAFSGDAAAQLANGDFDELYVTDSIISSAHRPEGTRTITIAPLFAQAITCLHNDDSLVELLAI